MELRLQEERFERADRAAIRAHQLEKLEALVAATWAGNAFYRDHWRAAGMESGQIGSILDFGARVPVVRTIYGVIKQIFDAVLAQSEGAFRDVVLIEYPRKGIWVIGFITSNTEGEVQRVTPDDMVNVFLPTTPNPTSGFLLFVPRKDCIVLDMTVEEGVKLVISGGIVSPPDKKAPHGEMEGEEGKA